MTDTGFPRSDELPPGAATGYLHATGLRTNVLHVPVRGSGDGGADTTAADVHRLWDAVIWGRVVPPELVAAMTTPRDTDPSSGLRRLRSWTVLSNTGEGAWPLARLLASQPA